MNKRVKESPALIFFLCSILLFSVSFHFARLDYSQRKVFCTIYIINQSSA